MLIEVPHLTYAQFNEWLSDMLTIISELRTAYRRSESSEVLLREALDVCECFRAFALSFKTQDIELVTLGFHFEFWERVLSFHIVVRGGKKMPWLDENLEQDDQLAIRAMHLSAVYALSKAASATVENAHPHVPVFRLGEITRPSPMAVNRIWPLAKYEPTRKANNSELDKIMEGLRRVVRIKLHQPAEIAVSDLWSEEMSKMVAEAQKTAVVLDADED